MTSLLFTILGLCFHTLISAPDPGDHFLVKMKDGYKLLELEDGEGLEGLKGSAESNSTSSDYNISPSDSDSKSAESDIKSAESNSKSDVESDITVDSGEPNIADGVESMDDLFKPSGDPGDYADDGGIEEEEYFLDVGN
ncbi:uncharacterized protein LOC111711507 [Eurytemora carolleeae]|uniref:uncharacterized protein LOC111711507 n=1 Tax=Eurytemora carolleeae TaxID=1294199 RepID=UPI000C78E14E|nr:uncharacterized protein LOC111711507 [Eurytemora carolleeae]|eukprot:XP_023341652.1 uncharacterized protein LOC111711507 [Eurytemora affinis]